jgi:hypothetical protein
MMITVTATATDQAGATAAAVTSATITDSFTLGATEPTAANTGLNVLGLTTADLTVVNGDLLLTPAYVTANGAAFDRLWVKGFIVMTAAVPVTFTNCLIEGRTFTGTAPYEALIKARSTSTPASALISFANCLIRPVQPDVGICCAAGERLGSFDRCDISLGSDQLDYWAPAVPNVTGCYMHDYSFWSNDPKHASDGTHPGWCHPDMIQNSGSSGGFVRGNSFDVRAAVGVGDVATLTGGGFPNRNYGSACILTPSTSHITGFTIQDNWARFGEVHFCLPLQNNSFDTGNSWTVTGNRHDYGVHGYGPYSGLYSKQFIRWGQLEGPLPADVHDNVWLSDANVPTALRGTLMPGAVTQGSGTTGQYMVSSNSATQ